MNTATAPVTAPTKAAQAYGESEAEAAACKQIEYDQMVEGYVPAPITATDDEF